MDMQNEKIDLKHLLTSELGIEQENIPDKPRQIQDLFSNGVDDDNSSLAEEDLQETHKKLTETIANNN